METREILAKQNPTLKQLKFELINRLKKAPDKEEFLAVLATLELLGAALFAKQKKDKEKLVDAIQTLMS